MYLGVLSLRVIPLLACQNHGSSLKQDYQYDENTQNLTFECDHFHLPGSGA